MNLEVCRKINQQSSAEQILKNPMFCWLMKLVGISKEWKNAIQYGGSETGGETHSCGNFFSRKRNYEPSAKPYASSKRSKKL